MAQHHGTVAWFNNAKGYGFLSYAGGPDVFVHFSAIQMNGYHTLKEGELVEFDIIKGKNGPQADQVVTTNRIVTPVLYGGGVTRLEADEQT